MPPTRCRTPGDDISIKWDGRDITLTCYEDGIAMPLCDTRTHIDDVSTRYDG